MQYKIQCPWQGTTPDMAEEDTRTKGTVNCTYPHYICLFIYYEIMKLLQTTKNFHHH